MYDPSSSPKSYSYRTYDIVNKTRTCSFDHQFRRCLHCLLPSSSRVAAQDVCLVSVVRWRPPRLSAISLPGDRVIYCCRSFRGGLRTTDNNERRRLSPEIRHS